MAQREALTRLLHGLHLDGPLEQSRRRIVDELAIGASLRPEPLVTRLIDDIETINPPSAEIDVEGFVSPVEFDPKQQSTYAFEAAPPVPPTANDFALLGRQLEVPPTFMGYSNTPAQPGPSLVSADTKLDFFLQVSAQLHRDDRSPARLLDIAGPQSTVLHDFARSTLDPGANSASPDQVQAFLGAIDRVAPRLAPAVHWHGPGGQPATGGLAIADAHLAVIDELGAENSAAAQAVLQLLDANRAIGWARSTCNASLVRVSLDGRGDFAVFVETITTIDVAAAPDPRPNAKLSAHDITMSRDPATGTDHPSTFFNPQQWPRCNSFWRAMHEFDAADGVHRGQKLILERVGDAENEDWLPLTVLHFERQERPNTSTDPGPFRLSYRLIRDPAVLEQVAADPNLDLAGKAQALAFDDGAITVREYDDPQDGTPKIEVRITKVVLLNGYGLRSEGQSMAALICQSGWGDQTRDFLTNCIYGQGI